jgi:hypothetical protein
MASKLNEITVDWQQQWKLEYIGIVSSSLW